MDKSEREKSLNLIDKYYEKYKNFPKEMSELAQEFDGFCSETDCCECPLRGEHCDNLDKIRVISDYIRKNIVSG